MNTATQEQEQERTDAANGPGAEAPPEGGPLTRTGAMGFGLAPRNFDEGWRMANVFAKSAMVPKQYQNKPEDIIIAMQYGAEIGLPPMAALQSVAVINGKPGVYGDGFLGVIQSKPAYAKHVEYYELADGTRVKGLRQEDYANDETKAVSMFWRKGNPDPFVGEFSIGEAKRAKLWGKDGPWSTYPARQLKWRARGFAGRDGFSAELRGVKMAEELFDTPDDDNLPEVHDQPIPDPVRRSERAAAVAETTAPATGPVAETPTAHEQSAPGATAKTKSAGRGSTQANPPAPPKPASATGDGPSVTTQAMVITDFQYCTPRGQEPYYEIGATVKARGEAPVAFTFVTQDEPLAKMAASCEGTDTPFNVSWHSGRMANGKPCKWIEKIEAAN